MKNLFVTYETALILKEKGFNEPCLAWYYSDRSAMGKLHLEYSEPNTKYHLNAPIYQQIVDWLSKEHDVHFSIFHSNDAYNDYRVRIYKSLDKSRYTSFYLRNGDNNLDETKIMFMFNSYQEALCKAIEEALKLI